MTKWPTPCNAKLRPSQAIVLQEAPAEPALTTWPMPPMAADATAKPLKYVAASFSRSLLIRNIDRLGTALAVKGGFDA